MYQGRIRARHLVRNSVTQGRFMWANRPYTWQRKAAPAGGREGVCVVSLGVGWLGILLVESGKKVGVEQKHGRDERKE